MREGVLAPTRTFSSPRRIQSKSCSLRARSASCVGTWSLKAAYPIVMLWGRLMMSIGPGAPSTGPYQQNVPDRRSDASDP
jgi:hypothetical protein